MTALLLLALLLAQAAPAGAPPPPDDIGKDYAPILVEARPDTGCGPPYAQLYIAPMGEPLRTKGHSDPMRLWIEQADKDGDGRVSLAEYTADADRFFTRLDTEKDDELDPQEVSYYELELAPEIRVYKPGSFRMPQRGKAQRQAKREARDRVEYGVPYGAGLFSSLNVPEPVASADLDINRGVSRAEWAQTSYNRFQLLDSARRGYLQYEDLPRSPAQQAIDRCRAEEARRKK